MTGRSAGSFLLQAAIAAVHDEATRAEETDWPQIVAFYDVLMGMADNPMVALNRATTASMRCALISSSARAMPRAPSATTRPPSRRPPARRAGPGTAGCSSALPVCLVRGAVLCRMRRFVSRRFVTAVAAVRVVAEVATPVRVLRAV
jgi:hypothetical protein